MMMFNLANVLTGKLVGTLGLEREFAVAVAGVIASGGLTYAIIVYPFLAPFIGTLQGVVAIFGISGIIGF
ncbi:MULTISPECIES: hypothetical protein [Rossellomorea]|nr:MULTISPECIES: hypothetical protein [Rossellomorea]WGG45358.1 hypothetical protein P8596_22070 [Rossellomorea sp. DA94]